MTPPPPLPLPLPLPTAAPSRRLPLLDILLAGTACSSSSSWTAPPTRSPPRAGRLGVAAAAACWLALLVGRLRLLACCLPAEPLAVHLPASSCSQVCGQRGVEGVRRDRKDAVARVCHRCGRCELREGTSQPGLPLSCLPSVLLACKLCTRLPPARPSSPPLYAAPKYASVVERLGDIASTLLGAFGLSEAVTDNASVNVIPQPVRMSRCSAPLHRLLRCVTAWCCCQALMPAHAARPLLLLCPSLRNNRRTAPRW